MEVCYQRGLPRLVSKKCIWVIPPRISLCLSLLLVHPTTEACFISNCPVLPLVEPREFKRSGNVTINKTQLYELGYDLSAAYTVAYTVGIMFVLTLVCVGRIASVTSNFFSLNCGKSKGQGEKLSPKEIPKDAHTVLKGSVNCAFPLLLKG